MAPEQPARQQSKAAADPSGGLSALVSPVIVVSQEFPARPSSLPDAHEFVGGALAAGDFGPAPHAAVTGPTPGALLAAASRDLGVFVVVIRLFPDEAEIEVLSAAEAGPSVPRLPD